MIKKKLKTNKIKITESNLKHKKVYIWLGFSEPFFLIKNTIYIKIEK